MDGRPRFVEVHRRFSASRDVTPAEYRRAAALLGRPLDEMRLADVDITLLMQPEHLPQVERHVRAVKEGLEAFGLWYGRYPYRTLTVVDPPYGALGSGGMEYPTFFTAGTAFLVNYWPLSGVLLPELVSVHEFGHQFWYGLVGSNEFEEAWLDEGMTSYSTGRLMDRVYGPKTSIASLPGLRVGDLDLLRATNSPRMDFDRVLKPAWEYSSFGSYGFYAYEKPEIVLDTLEGMLGEQVMARVMRTYAERWRFRHPSSADFFAVASEVSGRDLGWFFDATIVRPGILDYEVAEVSTREVRPARGVFEGGGARTGSDASQGQAASRSYESTALVRRRGEIALPVDIAFKFAGQAPERVRWDGRERWVRYRFVRPQRLEWVDIDPDRKVILDADWLNNARRVEPDTRVKNAWTTEWLFWVQNLLALLAG